jgi:5-hydroxyisourate hydrolase
MNRISTHVLDVALGKPAPNIPVVLERRSDPAWTLLSSAHTDADGRCAQLLATDEVLLPGVYRLRFDIASYHGAQRVEVLYPVVEITFRVREGESAFHLPLLLSPYGYTTYRGT